MSLYLILRISGLRRMVRTLLSLLVPSINGVRNGNGILMGNRNKSRPRVLGSSTRLATRMKSLTTTRTNGVLPIRRRTTLNKNLLTRSRLRRNKFTHTQIARRGGGLTIVRVRISVLRNELYIILMLL